MATKIILVCDRCGFELSDRADVAMALEGSEAWIEATRARGERPRGVFPCKHFVRCGGEMQPVKK